MPSSSAQGITNPDFALMQKISKTSKTAVSKLLANQVS